MKALLTGSGGLIGSECVRMLATERPPRQQPHFPGWKLERPLTRVIPEILEWNLGHVAVR